MEKEKDDSRNNDDWDKRTLCSDPACIGVIGSDGRCKECGKPYEGEAFPDFADSDTTIEPEQEMESEEDDSQEEDIEQEEEGIDDEEWKRRTLCSDPACIGVIGSDGRCKECGRPYEDKPKGQ
ncbi:MAG: hypothetical protein JRH18_06640 [Deltaproteobacteria bacterium]|nr:hypothetical protein [Deltaproteobacteria bacterium]MBW2151331.1 hypothetical protein [Deltaproteobacteria bacterium]